MIWTRLPLYGPSKPSTGGWQPLRFDGGAFHVKGTAELARALLVLRLCAWPPLVTHGLAVSSRHKVWPGSLPDLALSMCSLSPSFRPGLSDSWDPGSQAHFFEHPSTGSLWPGRQQRK
jgi:hydroxyproline oxidase